MNVITASNLSEKESTLYEEDSYNFLQYYQFAKEWYLYDSDSLGLGVVTHLINHFAAFHGKIPFSEDVPLNDSFWSSVPLGIFKYKLTENNSYSLLLKANKKPGYIVEGAYWDNGFFYVVKDQDKIIQAKLFIDLYTKETRSYPELSYL